MNYVNPPSFLYAPISSYIIHYHHFSSLHFQVMGQTNQKWVLKDCYRGVQWQVLRTTGLLVFIFGTLDMFRRKTEVLKTVTGNFLVTCGASAGSYVICWPLETLKNLAQAGRYGS